MTETIFLTYKQALLKAQNLCAKQDRSHQYIRNKLYDWKVNTIYIESIITDLIGQDFLNEERFAKAYCRGKFNQNNWGRNKIIKGLKLQKVSSYCIRIGIKEIDDEEYDQKLKQLLDKKLNSIKEKNQFIKHKKAVNYLISKGYESQLVWDEIRSKI